MLQEKTATWVLFGVTAVLGAAMEVYAAIQPDDPIATYDLETIPGILYNISRVACAIFFAFMVF